MAFNPNENNSVLGVSRGSTDGAISLYRFNANTRMSVNTSTLSVRAEFTEYAFVINRANNYSAPYQRGTVQSINVNNFIVGAQTSLGNTTTGATVSEFLQLIYPLVAGTGTARGNVSTLDYSTLGPRQVITYQTIEG